MNTIYLAGAIFAQEDKDCKDWRKLAKLYLKDRGFEFLDPMQRDYRGRQEQFIDEICHWDIAEIDQSDILLVNSIIPSFGTGMEVFYAKVLRRKKVYSFVDLVTKTSPWIHKYSDKVFPTLPEALLHINETYGTSNQT